MENGIFTRGFHHKVARVEGGHGGNGRHGGEKKSFVDDLVLDIQSISRKKTEKSWLWGHSHAKSLGKESDGA